LPSNSTISLSDIPPKIPRKWGVSHALKRFVPAISVKNVMLKFVHSGFFSISKIDNTSNMMYLMAVAWRCEI